MDEANFLFFLDSKIKRHAKRKENKRTSGHVGWIIIKKLSPVPFQLSIVVIFREETHARKLKKKKEMKTIAGFFFHAAL